VYRGLGSAPVDEFPLQPLMFDPPFDYLDEFHGAPAVDMNGSFLVAVQQSATFAGRTGQRNSPVLEELDDMGVAHLLDARFTFCNDMRQCGRLSESILCSISVGHQDECNSTRSQHTMNVSKETHGFGQVLEDVTRDDEVLARACKSTKAFLVEIHHEIRIDELPWQRAPLSVRISPQISD
jgi:hypothetical protein